MPAAIMPFDIQVSVVGGPPAQGFVTSGLMKEGVLWEQGDDDVTVAAAQGGADMLESFLLALACEGVAVDTAEFSAALASAVTAFANRQ